MKYEQTKFEFSTPEETLPGVWDKWRQEQEAKFNRHGIELNKHIRHMLSFFGFSEGNYCSNCRYFVTIQTDAKEITVCSMYKKKGRKFDWRYPACGKFEGR